MATYDANFSIAFAISTLQPHLRSNNPVSGSVISGDLPFCISHLYQPSSAGRASRLRTTGAAPPVVLLSIGCVVLGAKWAGRVRENGPGRVRHSSARGPPLEDPAVSERSVPTLPK